MKDSKTQNSIKKRNRFLKTWQKIFKEDSSLSILKVTATALTAISMALISTRLTGFVSSVVLVGLVSIASALVSEFYRVALSVTSLGAKKVIKPIARKRSITEQNDNADLTGPTVNNITETSNNPPKQDYDLIDYDKLPDSTNSDKSSDEEVTLWTRISEAFTKRPFLKISLLFFLVSAATIGASYYISDSKVGDVINYSTIQKTTVEELPDKDKQDIINTTLSTAAARDVESESQLQSKIQKLSEDNIKLSDKLDKLKTEQDEYKKTIENFEKRFVEIDSKIKPTPPASETPSTTIEEPVVPTEPGNTVVPSEPKLEDNAKKLNPEVDSDSTVKIEENEAL